MPEFGILLDVCKCQFEDIGNNLHILKRLHLGFLLSFVVAFIFHCYLLVGVMQFKVLMFAAVTCVENGAICENFFCSILGLIEAVAKLL